MLLVVYKVKLHNKSKVASSTRDIYGANICLTGNDNSWKKLSFFIHMQMGSSWVKEPQAIHHVLVVHAFTLTHENWEHLYFLLSVPTLLSFFFSSKHLT